MKLLKQIFVFVVVLGFTVIAKNYVSSMTTTQAVTIKEQAEQEIRKAVKSKTVFEVADSICQEADVPFALVKEIGQNESGWRYITNTNGGTDHGDLQVIDQTYWYWYEKLDLEGGKTRRNYLKVGIYYLKSLHNKYGSWKKARFAYGRGHWRDESTWTCLEQKFMNKIDWTKYDKPSYAVK